MFHLKMLCTSGNIHFQGHGLVYLLLIKYLQITYSRLTSSDTHACIHVYKAIQVGHCCAGCHKVCRHREWTKEVAWIWIQYYILAPIADLKGLKGV